MGSGYVHFCFRRSDIMLTSYLQDKLLTIALTGEIDHHSARQM